MSSFGPSTLGPTHVSASSTPGSRAVQAVADALLKAEDISPGWYRAKYRPKSEALHKMYGADWNITYVPHPVSTHEVLHGFLLSAPDNPTAGVISVVFPHSPTGWFNPYESPSGEPEHPLGPQDDFVPGRVLLTHGLATDGAARLRLNTLRQVASSAACGADLGSIVKMLARAVIGYGDVMPSQDIANLEARATSLYALWLDQHTTSGTLSAQAASAFLTLRLLNPDNAGLVADVERVRAALT